MVKDYLSLWRELKKNNPDYYPGEWGAQLMARVSAVILGVLTALFIVSLF